MTLSLYNNILTHFIHYNFLVKTVNVLDENVYFCFLFSTFDRVHRFEDTFKEIICIKIILVKAIFWLKDKMKTKQNSQNRTILYYIRN